MRANQARAARLMRESGIEALIACSPESVRYLTGYFCWLAPLFKRYMVQPGGSSQLAQRNLALLPLVGEPCLVVEPYWALDARESWVEDIRLAGTAPLADPPGPVSLRGDLLDVAGALGRPTDRDPIGALARALDDRGLAAARVGIEREAFHPDELDQLARLLPRLELVDCANLLRLVRAVKTADEIAALERGATIAEHVAREVFAAADAGHSVSRLTRAFRAGVAAEGADLDHFAVSLRGLGFLCESPRTLVGETALYVDFGCIYDGWFSDSGTTLCIGAPGHAERAAFEAVRDAVAAGAAAMAPGVRGSVVQAAMQQVMTAAGITATFPHGHGVGLEVRDYPIVMPDTGARISDDCIDVPADLPFEDGMVVNLETPVLYRGAFSAHCEQTFVVTVDGCRPLVPQDRSEPIVLGAA
jgi:Xaa-Pro dipeptidase